jgi:hypothetical protein
MLDCPFARETWHEVFFVILSSCAKGLKGIFLFTVSFSWNGKLRCEQLASHNSMISPSPSLLCSPSRFNKLKSGGHDFLPVLGIRFWVEILSFQRVVLVVSSRSKVLVRPGHTLELSGSSLARIKEPISCCPLKAPPHQATEATRIGLFLRSQLSSIPQIYSF